MLPVPRARVLPAVLLLLLIGHLALVLRGGGTGGSGASSSGALRTSPQPLALLAVPHAVPKVDDEAWETRDGMEGGVSGWK